MEKTDLFNNSFSNKLLCLAEFSNNFDNIPKIIENYLHKIYHLAK